MADRVIGLLVVALGFAYWSAAGALPRPLLRQAVGPEAFPRLIAAVLIGLGALLALAPSFRRPGRAATAGAGRGDAAGEPQVGEGDAGGVDAGAAVAGVLAGQVAILPDYRTLLLVLLGLGVYALIYERVGFVVSTFLLIVYEIGVMEVQSGHWLRTAMVSAGVSVGLYLLFVKILSVTLPLGILGGILG